MSRYYFGYGSNLSQVDWADWCRRHDASPEGLREIGPAYLPDWEVQFHYYSRSRDGGALDIKRLPGHAVAGYLFEVDAATRQMLDAKEGAGNRYERIETTAIDAQGQEFPVETYTVRDEHVGDFTPPTDEYRAIVEAAFGKRGFPLPANIIQAARNETRQSLVHGVFVYGTLRRGEIRFPIVEDYGIESIAPATLSGTLYDLGSYPGVSLTPNEQGKVVGEFIQLRDLPGAIVALDEVEGFGGFGGDDHLYRRVIQSVQVEGGTTALGWVYVYAQSLDGRPSIESGDWLRR